MFRVCLTIKDKNVNIEEPEVKTVVNKTDAFDDICEVCGTPDFKLLAIGSIPQACAGSKRHQYHKRLSNTIPRRRSYQTSRRWAKKFSRRDNYRLQWLHAKQCPRRQYYLHP
ncbi:Hypothetical predicted protein [Mytilus galloprovincialis]|uniref:Uncharacterized protein n=1 Tax=Mytilus galloprovincialis TaxID=29158 RepID=A0A8B6D954_MYTGA|nr:Hypothetical predicted protein [Mytilus galloprovincialis]